MLERMFVEVLSHGRSLVIVGDLFDFWFEWRHVIPKGYFRVLHQLRVLVDGGVSVHYLAGNHDFRLPGFLETEIGICVHPDSMAADVEGQAVFVYHGDGVLARDHGYRLVKRVLRNRFAQRLFSWLHPDLGMWLARGTSTTSRTYERYRSSDEEEYLALARRKFAEGFRGVVMGHTHRPQEVVEGECTYINLGDWIEHFTFGVHDGAQLKLARFSPGCPCCSS
jgi:UDP-2,3-diacylglucosamine hydrolase